jgi:hypothetical protein
MATKKTKSTTSKPAEKAAAAPAPAPAAAATKAAAAKAPVKAAAPKAVEKKPAEKPAPKAETKAAPAAAPAPVKVKTVSRGELDKLVREEAYRRAAARNFRNGSPVADWLAAEKQVLGQLAANGVTVA